MIIFHFGPLVYPPTGQVEFLAFSVSRTERWGITKRVAGWCRNWFLDFCCWLSLPDKRNNRYNWDTETGQENHITIALDEGEQSPGAGRKGVFEVASPHQSEEQVELSWRLHSPHHTQNFCHYFHPRRQHHAAAAKRQKWTLSYFDTVQKTKLTSFSHGIYLSHNLSTLKAIKL